MRYGRMAGLVICLAAAGLRADDGPAGQPEIKLVKPSVDKEAGMVSVPGAFWNEMEAIWIEVAFCGRPSDFLHETIVSTTTTRTMLMDAMHLAGFADAGAWVDNMADFPRVRGDRVLILVEVEREGKKETFALDEMISFRGWNVSVGPYGWMFKGGGIGAAGGGTAPTMGSAVEGGEKISDAMRIVADDPQVALQFRGLQHVSRSFIDYPLAYVDWVMPDFDYVRNLLIEPKILALGTLEPKDAVAGESAAAAHQRLLRQFWNSVYNSNGGVPVKIILQKVNEEQYLTETAKVWHDAAAAEFMRGQLETARAIDRDKAQWRVLLPEVRKMAADARIVDREKPIAQSPQFMRMALLGATIEKNYTAMDAAWAAWAAGHAIFDDDPTEREELEGQTKVWREHMQLVADHAAQMLIVEGALADAAQLEQKPDSPEKKRALERANGMEIEARSKAMLAANKQTLDVWKYRKESLKEDDPRVEMKRNILTQLALAEARAATGEAGIAYGRALESGEAGGIGTTQEAYQKASLAMTIAGLETELADIDFEISKREGMDDPDLPGMIKQRDAWRAELKAAQGATSRP